MQEPLQYGEDVQELLSLLQKDKSLKNFRDAFTNPQDLEEFAKKASFSVHDQGTKVFRQGEKGSNFFIILSGQLRAVDQSHTKPRLLGYFTTGSIVGERALLHNRVRTATVEVVVRAKLAWFDEDAWYWLIGKNSRFRDYFENLEATRLKESARDFPGRQWDEVVVASTKRHFIAFIATLPVPLSLLIAPVVFFLAAQIFGLQFLAIIFENLTLLATLPFIGLAALIMVYNYFDWRNDDFIVTTKRVVHIERILFFGEQRKDAPLTRIQDMTMISDIFDIVFDSDSLRIATAGAGTIEFTHIRRANYIREVIFREQAKAKERVASADIAALRQNLAHQLQWDEEELEQNVMAVAEAEGTIQSQPKTRHYNRLVDYFIPRIKEVNESDEGTLVMWRKHYWVLFTHILLPTLALMGSVYLFIASFVLWLPPFGAIVATPIQFGLGLAILACIVWYLWEYDDWNKDVYIVTNTQIIDIESAAFRVRRTRREGTFDNIQGVYSEIPNFFYKLINLGDVVIETAGSEDTFTFKKVFDPAAVTEEVFNRWATYQQKQREQQRDSTHQQVMEVLREYHKLASKVSRE